MRYSYNRISVQVIAPQHGVLSTFIPCISRIWVSVGLGVGLQFAAKTGGGLNGSVISEAIPWKTQFAHLNAGRIVD